MQYTPLLGADNSELGNIILGFVTPVSSLNDSLTLAETLTATKINPNKYDSILADQYTRLGFVMLGHVPYNARTSKQNLSLAQNISALCIPNRINDYLILTESIATPVNHIVITDNLVFNEYIDHYSGTLYVKHNADTLALTQTITLDRLGSNPYFDTLHFTETLARSISKIIHITDNLVLSQSTSFVVVFDSFTEDTLSLTQSIVSHKVAIHKIRDQLLLTDHIHRNIVSLHTIHDTIVFLHAIPVIINYTTTVIIPDIQVTVVNHPIACCTI